MNIYDIKVLNQQNEEVSLSEYKGKVMLIVNTATGCGFTPQYKELEELYLKYKDEGFVVLDFPCNQFGNQAPGDATQINQFCTIKYNTTFPRFAKIDVNGENESPLYTFLKEQKGGILGDKIKWNFCKFLVDKEGNVFDRYPSAQKPSKIEKHIVELLK